MNKLMILAILVVYKAFNDKSLSIVVNEDNHEYIVNDVVIDNIDSIDSIDGGIISASTSANGNVYCKTIYVDNIISIQFTDKRAIVGMKWYSNVATWNDVDKSVAESTPLPTLLSYLHLYTSSFKYYYLCFNS